MKSHEIFIFARRSRSIIAVNYRSSKLIEENRVPHQSAASEVAYIRGIWEFRFENSETFGFQNIRSAPEQCRKLSMVKSDQTEERWKLNYSLQSMNSIEEFNWTTWNKAHGDRFGGGRLIAVSIAIGSFDHCDTHEYQDCQFHWKIEWHTVIDWRVRRSLRFVVVCSL